MCRNAVLVVWDSSTVTMAEMQVSFVKVVLLNIPEDNILRLGVAKTSVCCKSIIVTPQVVIIVYSYTPSCNNCI